MVAAGRYSGRYYTRRRQIYEVSKRTGRYELLTPKRTSLRHRVPGADPGLLDFLAALLAPDPERRPTAAEALQHPWLRHAYPEPAAEEEGGGGNGGGGGGAESFVV
jgi:serine/threonine protein kinase